MVILGLGSRPSFWCRQGDVTGMLIPDYLECGHTWQVNIGTGTKPR